MNIFAIKQLTSVLIFFWLNKKNLKNTNLFFFFPFYHTGGAEQVHLNILKALKNKNNFVFFTGNSNSNKFLSEFKKHSKVVEINLILKNNILKIFIKNQIIKLINNQEATVFGCNSFFFYETLPLLNDSIKKIDLIHAFSTPDYGIEQYSISYIKYLDNRVVINNVTKFDLINQYKLLNLDSIYQHRIIKIENGIEINKNFILRKSQKIKIGFVGRWSKEKRPELFLEIAKSVMHSSDNVSFNMIGSGMDKKKDLINKYGINFIGEIINNKQLEKHYQSLNILLVTSYREGFPMVIMEAMAKGVVIIATNVGGIGEHVKNNYNGILIENNPNEPIIINNFIESINGLLNSKENLERIAKNGYLYALENFGIQKFNQNYQELLVNEK